MKTKLIIISIVSIFFIDGYAQKNSQSGRFYYYKGQKIYVNVNRSKFIVYFEDDISDIEGFASKKYKSSVYIKSNKKTIVKELSLSSPKDYEKEINLLKKDQRVKAIELVIGDSITVPVSNNFYVKLKHSQDTIVLQKIANETKSKILRPVSNCPNWFVLEVDKRSVSDCIGVSNIFYESGLFESVDPGFIFNFSRSCRTDNQYYAQWAIDNLDFDINACDAWDITTGSNNIVLAVIDQGIDNGHREFNKTHFVASYDAENRVTLAQLYDDHGTHVCGIISSNHDKYDIAGVAPNLSIMEISHSLLSHVNTISEDLAAGINWAVANGADILSNSWGDQGGRYYNDLHSTLLEDAIDNAIDNGRNGLGCVVVFAAGNFAPAMDYPAYYRNEILVVGAINKYGFRWDKSGFGNDLDVVAPGFGIKSTIRSNQYATWNGTSMAVPHVSAIAGLILTLNPYLTQKQVVDIIESTAQKISVGVYNYQTNPGRPNGIWDLEVGYGLVDAAAAVQTCPETNIVNKTINDDTDVIGCVVNINNVDVENNSKLTIDAENNVEINGEFTVELGSELEIR